MDRNFADLSNNNAQAIQWKEYAKAGHVLVGLKATEGQGFVDQTHGPRSEAAHSEGVWVLHYHFGHPNLSASAQASHFWGQIRGHFAKKDFACLDIEVTDGQSWAQIANWSEAFISELAKLSGHSSLVYSSADFLSHIVASGLRWPGQRGWIAAYGPNKPSVPSVKGWAWQYTDGNIGPLPHHYMGIGNCDGSLLNWGTYLRLRLTKP